MKNEIALPSIQDKFISFLITKTNKDIQIPKSSKYTLTRVIDEGNKKILNWYMDEYQYFSHIYQNWKKNVSLSPGNQHLIPLFEDIDQLKIFASA